MMPSGKETVMEHVEAVTQLLGGSGTFPTEPKSDLDFIGMVRSGFPVSAVDSAAKFLSLTEEQAFSWLKIPKRTAARRKAKGQRLREVESERLLRLARVAASATEVLGSREKAVGWLTDPNRALGGERPIELLDTDVGFQNVMDVLLRIEYGVFS
jgi:putative toxin-antitoxin system antitoxin component (TIGR02293 family)